MLAALTRKMLEQETSTTLPKLAGMEVAPYIDQSMARIRNTAIRHRCHQIGTDGSQKIVQRLVDPLRERLAAGQPAGLLTLAVASWIAYGLSGARRFGARWTPSDPYAETVIAIGEKNSDWSELARAVLSIAPIFGSDMARPRLVEPDRSGICAVCSAATREAISENGSAMNSRRDHRAGRRRQVADAGVGAALGYSRPGSYEELRAVLSSGTARLPKKLRQVAIHLWQHPTAVALGTVTSVAGEAGVQPSTLVRFAQAFGYSGFSDLQEVFKAHLAGGGRSRDRWESASSSEAARLVDGFIGSSTAALAGVRDRLDLAQFEMMSETLAAADLIYIIGSKRAFSLVSYVSLALANLGVRNLALDNVGSTAFELLRCAATSDAVLAVSFTPYNSITPELAASAAQRGVPIVSLTDSAFSPLVPVSKAYVEVIEESFSGFKSLSATLAVAMALVLRVEQRRSEAAARGRDVSNIDRVGRGEEPEMRKWRIVGLSFEHAHMGDLLREVYEHPNAEIVGSMGCRQGEDGGGSRQLLHSQRARLS